MINTTNQFPQQFPSPPTATTHHVFGVYLRKYGVAYNCSQYQVRSVNVKIECTGKCLVLLTGLTLQQSVPPRLSI